MLHVDSNMKYYIAKPYFPHLGAQKTFCFLFSSFVYLFNIILKENSPNTCSLPSCVDFTISILEVLKKPHCHSLLLFIQSCSSSLK